MNEFKKFVRLRKHKSYVESRVLELRSNITIQAITTGCADEHTRVLFLKYNNYLKKL